MKVAFDRLSIKISFHAPIPPSFACFQKGRKKGGGDSTLDNAKGGSKACAWNN